MRWTSRTTTSTPIENLDYRELALDLQWCWDHAAEEVWQRLEPELWELTHNPWVVLQTVSAARLKELETEPRFRKLVAELLSRQREARTPVCWFQQHYRVAPFSCVAYFSMEFGLSEALPIYSGGLGNVAGDQLKAACDLGVPLVGVGLLYQQGYFRQAIDPAGAQLEIYPHNDPGQLPIAPVRDLNGEWLRLHLEMPGYGVWLRVWQAEIGRVKLYLLDSNDPANLPVHRGVTSELYGGGPELRLEQEIVLGIGGWRLLHELGLQPEVCHLNEGHAAFAVLERARTFMEETNRPFAVALAATRAGNLFTTHTPVDAGFDRFSPALMHQYLQNYAETRLRISFEDLMTLGRFNPDDPGEPFNMAYLAIRGSGAVNGVSRLHGAVSRRIFQPLFPRWPECEVPVGHVTNGVHTPTWDSAEADSLWTAACGPERWREGEAGATERIRALSDATLWTLRAKNRRGLVDYARKRMARQLSASGAEAEAVANVRHVFDPDALTLGFARRFATYKRPKLLLHDPERLMRILTDPRRPVQLVLAGKAHPKDEAGKAMVQEWVRFVRRADVRLHAIFLADYDLLLAEQLVRGVDVWINTPRRPWEASGTSGMKVLVNGGLNLSELDGWWAEAYSPEVGWALGDGHEHDDDPAWDAREAEALYDLLEHQVAPEFYARDASGIPVAWVARVRESMARLTPQFSAARMLRDYVERYYVPAAVGYGERAADRGAVGEQLIEWQRRLAERWGGIHFGHFDVERVGDHCVFRVQVSLNEVEPDSVEVELFAEPRALEAGAERIAMIRKEALVGAANGFVYEARLAVSRPANDYTPRVIPHHPAALVPLEAAQILWKR
jgi:starch phosphorylase